MTTQAQKAELFLALHDGDSPLLLANAWDQGSAKVLAAIGFQALATTSAGHAATLGRRDGKVTRDEALAHARDIVGATDLPVSCDFENGFADAPADVAANVTLALATGLAGASVEDSTKNADDPIYEAGFAAERVAAAVEAAHAGDVKLVVTARAENYLHGRRDLADTIARLQAFQAAGADVLYAPGVTDADEIRAIVEAVERPVNVLALPGVPTIAELGDIGVKRVSVGSAFNLVALGAVVDAGRELLDTGTYGFWAGAGTAMSVAPSAFTD
jgi:2-methylisocitrate lyase-like PEP mutase family enzyme